jgi:hypothetical protein
MLFCIVPRGKKKGIRSYPWQHRDGTFHVMKKKGDEPIRVNNEGDLKSYLERGYSVRMGNKNEGHPPGLVRPESIHGWKRTG